MKNQFVVSESLIFPNGKVALAGTVIGPHLNVGQRGVATTASGLIKIEIISIGVLDSTRVKPNMQALQIKILEGLAEALKGATFQFE